MTRPRTTKTSNLLKAPQHIREILRLALPTVITMLSQTLMWTVDTALLGRVSNLAQGAAGLGGIIVWLLYSFFNNTARMNGTFVSQANGAGDDDKVGQYTWQAIYFSLFAGFVLVLACFASDLILPLTGNGPRIEAATYSYIRLRGISAPAALLSFSLGGFFLGLKDTRTPMWAALLGNTFNVVLDVILIFGWPAAGIAAMGIEGAAIATSVGVYVQVIYLAVALFVPRRWRRRYAIHQPRAVNGRQLWDLLRIGTPASLGAVVDMAFFAVFTSVVGRNGEAALAANQINVQLLSFSFMPVFGLSSAATVLVGNAIGARDLQRARDFARETYMLALGYCLVVGLLLYQWGAVAYRLFSSDVQVLALAPALAALAAFFQFFDGMQIVGGGVLGGGGDTRFPLIYTMVILWFVGLPLIVLAPRFGFASIDALWTISSLSYALISLGLYLRVRAGHWQRISIFS